MAKSDLLDDYLSGIDLLKRSVAGMSRAEVLARPIEGKWSTLEVVAHLADFEPIFADRVKRIIAVDRPLLIAADEEPFARSLSYQERDLDVEVELIALTRQQLARILRSKSSEVFERVGVHSHAGLISVEQVLTLAARHIRHHVPFIDAKKQALGLSA